MVNNSAIVSLNHDLGSSGQKSDLESPSPPPPPVSPVRDVTPLPLLDLQLAVIFVINGKTLEDTKEQTVKIEQDYHGFMYDIQLLCDSRLPRGIRWSSEGIDIVWKRAWISPMQMKGMEKHGEKEELSFRTFEDEGVEKHHFCYQESPSTLSGYEDLYYHRQGAFAEGGCAGTTCGAQTSN